MIWRGKEILTTQDLTEVVSKIPTPEEAQQFMLEYVKETHHARANVGYVAGYLSNKEKHRIFKWFDVVHPIFGTKDLEPEDIIKLGMAMGENAKKRYVESKQ